MAKVPTDRQVIARLKREGRNEDYIRSYMRGWRAAGGYMGRTTNENGKRNGSR